MDGKTFAGISAVAFIALAITATVIEMARKDDRAEVSAQVQQAISGRNPLEAELARCSGLGEAGPRDLACLKAWADNRRRFLGQDQALSVSPVTDKPTTKETSPADLPTPDQLAPTRPEVR